MLYIWSSIVLYRFCWRFRRGWDSACPRSRVSMKTVVVDPRSPIAGRCSTPTRAEKWRLVGGQHAWNSGENLGRLESQCGECLSNQLHPDWWFIFREYHSSQGFPRSANYYVLTRHMWPTSVLKGPPHTFHKNNNVFNVFKHVAWWLSEPPWFGTLIWRIAVVQ